MPPEDSAVSTPEGPLTPEMVSSDILNSNSKEQRHAILPPTAPKGKPKAPPLIHGKVKINEADGDMAVGSGSKIPLLKTKHLETSHHGESKKRTPNFSSNQSSSRSVKGEKSSMEVHRTVEKVRVQKGIEMRRVVQESSGIKAKKYTSTVQNSKPTLAAASTKNSSQGPANGPHRRKMTKTEASFPEVKSFTGHLGPSSSGTSLGVKLKPNDVDSKEASTENKNSSPERKQPEASNSKVIVNEEETVTPKPQEGDPPAKAENFKTLDEFLKMPETSLPETKSHSPVKKTIYKSKFWEYVDPKNTGKTKSSSKEHKKPYDPDAVKDFMQKQKELRKIQQKKETKEREAESAKRQRMLKELDSKCQRIAASKVKQRASEELHFPDNSEETGNKKPKLEMCPPPQSPSMKYLKPLLERKQGTLLRKSDVARQSQYLLTEFENIVKRECISFLQKIPVPSSQTNMDGTVQKVDKAVATSTSLMDLNSVYSEQKQIPGDDGTEAESFGDVSKQSRIPSPRTIEGAVIKIQALYRGYKVRQAMKEARVYFQRSVYMRRSENLHHSVVTGQHNQNQINPSRRWSFPRMPEKPYDNNMSRLLPMSPIPMTGMGLSSNHSLPCYIPPPTPSGQVPRSPSRPRVLPSFPLTPARVYNEPYPKQSRKSTENLDRANGNMHLPQTMRGEPALSVPPQTAEDFAVGRSHHSRPHELFQNLPTPTDSANRGFEFAVPSSLPSIVDVLREKIRLFSSENIIGAASSNVVQRTSEETRKGVRESHGETQKEKPSASESRSEKILGKESGDISTTTAEDHVLEHEDGVTPKIKKHKRRSRPRSQRSPVGDSTTTVDTDAEYAPSASRSSMSVSVSQLEKVTAHSVPKGSRSEEIIRSSSLEEPTTTSSLGNFLAPALQLRYEAEREHLKIIEKALQVRLQSNAATAGSTDSVRNKEQLQETSKKASAETDRVQLAIANCQKESMQAAAEMTKWMAELQKSTKEQERVQFQQAPVDLAATVFAAVEQARLIGIEKRRSKRLRQEQSQQKLQQEQRKDRPLPEAHSETTYESESQSSDVRSKVDRSAETGLSLITNFQEGLAEKEKQKTTGAAENAGVIKNLKDYQQQFPSGSEADSPVHVAPLAPSFAVPVNEYETRISSRHSSPENAKGVPFEEPVDYPSIIPSGNSVDFTSLDPRVSTLENVSQISSEMSEKADYLDDKTFVEDVPSELPGSAEKVSQQSSLAEVASDQSASGTFNDDLSPHHSGSTIVDEAPASEKSKSILTVSNVHSRAEIISEHLDVAEDESFQTSMAIEDEADDLENESVSTDSKIEEVVSEQSKMAEASPQSRIEIEVPEDESFQSSLAIEDEAGDLEIEPVSTDSKIEEVVSEQSKMVDEASRQSRIEIEADNVNSNYTDFEENVSLQSKISEDLSAHSNENIQMQPKIEERVSEQSNLEDKENIADQCSGEGISQESKLESKTEHILTEPEITKREETPEEVSVEDDASNDTFEPVEDKATETELHEDNESISDKDISIIEEGTKLEDDNNFDHSPVDDLVESRNTIEKSEKDLEVPSSEAKVSVSVEIPEEASKESEANDNESSVLDAVKDEHSADEEQPSQDKLLNKEVSPPRSSATVVEESLNYDDKFEEDVTDQSKFVESISEIMERIKSLEQVGSPQSDESLKKGSESESISESLVKSAREIPLKPPPPYTPRETVPVQEEPDSSRSSSEAKVPSLEILSQTPSSEESSKSGASVEKEKESELTPVKVTSQQSGPVENISDKTQFEDDDSTKSQIIEETSERTKLDELKSAVVEKLNAEATSRELERIPQDVFSKPEFEVPLKPPPPYSPSSSLESTSLSSRSLMVSLPDEKLQNIVTAQAEVIWEVWKSGGITIDLFPDINTVMNVMYEKELAKVALEPSDSNANENAQSAAEQSFDSLVCHLIYETMKEVLQVKNEFTNYVEQVRPGPLALEAQKQKIPKTKDALVSNVISRVLKIIPSAFFSDFHVSEKDKPKLRKWCSRPRELVDEILLEELIEEDYQWTEWWPEEVIVSHHISRRIMQKLISSVLEKRKYVYSQ